MSKQRFISLTWKWRQVFLLAAGVVMAWTVDHHAGAAVTQFAVTREGVNLNFTWRSIPGTTYSIQASTDLETNSWNNVATVEATGITSSWSVTVNNEPSRFWRLGYPSPVLLDVQPGSILPGGGQTIYFSGLHLAPGDWIRIGGLIVTDIQYLGHELWSIVAPNLPPGTYDIDVVSSETGLTLATLDDALVVGSSGLTKLFEPPDPAPGEPRSKTCGTSKNVHQVYGFSGAFKYLVTDVDIPGRGLDFKWCRTYRSRGGGNTPMGNGWTHSYDIGVTANGSDMEVSNGTGRRDLFKLQPDGSYSCNQFFSEGSLSANVFTLRFPDNGKWLFNALDGSPKAGKIDRIIDRNLNSLQFDYSLDGRLLQIVDDLGRANTISYDTNGMISSLTDFSGRQWSYRYYGAGDPNGAPGDLRAIISPAVVGTPNGNDFPDGKTNTYTYSTGFGDNRLNHNLLSIQDAKEQIWLRNEYSASTNPSDLNFDRVRTQILGELTDRIQFEYVSQAPRPSNGFATIKCIRNDRVGNVSEDSFSATNNLVLHRNYTGRANPSLPTTTVVNRPINPLRTTDPAFFDTKYVWDDDSLLIETVLANGNSIENVYERTLSPTSPRRSWGNLRERHRSPGPLGGDQAELVEFYEYDSAFGCGGCGSNFVTRHVDARGNQTMNSYDNRGNRTNTVHRISSITEQWEYNAFGQLTAHVLPDNGNGHRRRDERTYYASGPQKGYLKDQIVDAGFEALTTTYEFDSVGNLVREINPRGYDRLFTVNRLNQRIRELSEAVALAGNVRYERLHWFDANNNLVRTDVQNRDSTGALQANTHFSTITEYEILNRARLQIREKGAAQLASTVLTLAHIPVPARPRFTLTEYAYDANRNQILVRTPEAMNGNQPSNVAQTQYDERNLVFRVTRAPGHPDQSSAQQDYDPNGNLMRVFDGLEDPQPHETAYSYDGYDRRIMAIDPMGNAEIKHYDPNGNLVSRRIDGELTDLPGSANNVRLREGGFTYDAEDRKVREDIIFFNPATQNPIGDGLVTTRTTYSAASHVLQVVNDNNHTNRVVYDTVYRPKVVTDAAGNTVATTYDADNNVLSVTETDRSGLGNPDQAFTTSYGYDERNRMIVTRDNLTNETSYAYDSRDNRVVVTDQRGTTTRVDYDGLGRSVATRIDMNSNGVGTDAEDIVTLQIWDDNSRLIGQTDDNANTTRYGFDSLDRPVSTTFADGTTNAATYNIHGNRISFVDANGTVVASSYDDADRLLTNSIIPASGVLDSTGEVYAYDGLSRVVHASDDDSVVIFAYDSLSHRISETLNNRTTSCVYDGLGNMTACVYPGGRTVTRTFTGLELCDTISDTNGLIADYSHAGRRVERVDFGNATRADYTYDGISGVPNAPDDFGVKRLARTSHTHPGTAAIIDDRAYSYDRARNKTRRTDLRAQGPAFDQEFDVDPAHRLVRTVVTDSIPNTVRDEQYQLDGAQNRRAVVGGLTPGTYALDSTLPSPADAQVNQYTTTPVSRRFYDSKGNTINIRNTNAAPQTSLSYNFRSLQVGVFNHITGQNHAYKYDALGRRIARIVDVSGVSGGPFETRYFYCGTQVCEERDGLDRTTASYILGPTIDHVVSMRRAGTNYYYHADDLGSVMALSDDAGRVVERYDYGDFGQPLNPQTLLPVAAPSPAGNPYLFTGRRFDTETGHYWFRTRYLDPRIGRFLSPDSIGLWGDKAGLGNGFVYVANNPMLAVDPYGTAIAAIPLAEALVIVGFFGAVGSFWYNEWQDGREQDNLRAACYMRVQEALDKALSRQGSSDCYDDCAFDYADNADKICHRDPTYEPSGADWGNICANNCVKETPESPEESEESDFHNSKDSVVNDMKRRIEAINEEIENNEAYGGSGSEENCWREKRWVDEGGYSDESGYVVWGRSKWVTVCR